MPKYAVIILDRPEEERDENVLSGYVNALIDLEVISDVTIGYSIKGQEDVSLIPDRRAREITRRMIEKEIKKYKELGAEGGPQYIVIEAAVNDEMKLREAIRGLKRSLDVEVRYEIFDKNEERL